MENLPSQITFISGQHRGLTFTRGKGPSHRMEVQGMSWLINSPELWYSAFGGNFIPNRAVGAGYLSQHRDTWRASEK